MNRADLKRLAKQNLSGKLGSAILVSLVYYLLVFALGSTFIGSLLFSTLLTICIYNVFLKGRSSETYNLNDATEPLNSNISNRIMVSLMKEIYLFLWSLLFIIPGLIKSYSYAMTDFLSLKHPEWGHDECITQSRKIMDGHKFELFVLDLSFLGWDLLSILTFGILAIVYVTPYEIATRVEYFNQLYSSNCQEVIQ